MSGIIRTLINPLLPAEITRDIYGVKKRHPQYTGQDISAAAAADQMRPTEKKGNENKTGKRNYSSDNLVEIL